MEAVSSASPGDVVRSLPAPPVIEPSRHEVSNSKRIYQSNIILLYHRI